MQAIQAKPSAAVVNEEPPRIRLQVFARDLFDGPELPASIADIPIGDWQTVELFLPAASGTLQIQPVNRPAVIEVREIAVHSSDGGIVWAAKALSELQALSFRGSLAVLPGKDCCLFFSFGSDPIWVLPSLNEPFTAVTLRVVLCIHKNFEAVSQAIVATYAEMDRMTAQVRTAFADRNKTLREYQRQVEAATADRNRALLNEKEQVRLAQLANTRNTELQGQKDALESELKALRAEHERLRQTVFSWEQSRSWRMTRPLRSIAILAQKLKRNFD